MDRMGHSSVRAALIYLHAARGASKTIAPGIDRHLAAAAQEKEAGRGDGADPSGVAGTPADPGGKRRQAVEVSGAAEQGRSTSERVTGIEPA